MKALLLLALLVSSEGPSAASAEPMARPQDEVVSSAAETDDTPPDALKTTLVPEEKVPERAPSVDATDAKRRDLANAVISSRGICATCETDVDLVELLKAEGSRLSDDENVVAGTIAKLEFLRSRPRITAHNGMQYALDADCFAHWVNDRRLLVRGAFMRLSDLASVDVESAFRTPVPSKEQVFGIPLSATLSRQACSSAHVVDACELREQFSNFPLRPDETKLPSLIACAGPRGDAFYAFTDGPPIMATFDPVTHQLDDEAALGAMKRAYGQPTRRFSYQLFFVPMNVWSIKLSRGGIFFQTAKNRPSVPVTAFEYRDVDALVAVVRSQRAAQKAAERQRARALIE